jgi:hypothetical protein
LIVLVAMLLGLSLVAAQENVDEQPLLKMLANVPDNATSRSEIYFNDRKAVEAAYPSAKLPADWSAFAAYRDDKGKSDSFKPIDLWWKVWRNQQSSRIAQYMGVSDEMANVVGFDFFTIEQEMNYGQPPQQTLQLSGAFDLDKVRAALTGQGYSRQDQGGVEVWCGADGCDSGAKTNLKDRNPSNPFGGDLGRKWPIIVQDNTLIGTPDATVIQNHVAVKSGNSASLGDAPEYRAAVEALTKNGVLMQAYFWDGDVLTGMSQLDPILITAKPELRKKIIADILKNYEPLPVYKLLAFGDVASDSQSAGEVALVYSSEDDAKKAAEILPKRLSNYTSLISQRPLTQLLADRGVTQPDVQVINSNGQYVVLVSFATAKLSINDILSMKSPAADSGSGDVIPPGSIYRLLVASAMQRDLGWLNTTPREILEAAAK